MNKKELLKTQYLAKWNNKELTKEECLEALENLKRYEECGTHPDIEDIQVFEKLINKHFDNPFLSLLSLDELLDGTVIVIKVEHDYIRAKKSFFGEWIHYNWRRQGGVFDE